MTVTIDEFEVADPADAWTRAGFSVDPDAVCRIGGVRIRLVGRGRGAAPAATSDTGTGIIGWSLRGLPSDGSLDDLDGVPTTRSAAVTAAPATHPNGVTAIDHVVLLSPDLGRTVESLAAVGVEPASGTERRTRRTTDPPDLLPVRRGDHRGRRFAGYGERGPIHALGDHLRRRGHRRDCLVLR